MKSIHDYIVAESVDVTAVNYDDLNQMGNDIFLTIENTRELWDRYAALMRSALKHEKRGDFDVAKLAGSSSFDAIIRAGKKESEKNGGTHYPRLTKENKLKIAAVLIKRWED